MNIAEILRARVRDCGPDPAIVEARRQATFAGLDELAGAVAGQLEAAGVRKGEAMLVFCPMSIALYATLIGLWRLGGVAMFLDPSAGREHIERCCRRVPPRAFAAIWKAHVLRLVSPALRAIPLKVSIDAWIPGTARLRLDARGGASPRIEPMEADAPALITFTSGSTGEPKAAVRTHGFLQAQHRVLEEDLHLSRGQRDLATLPIFVLANLASGVTSIIPDADLRRPGDIEPAPVLRQVSREGATRVAASPALLDRLARHAEASGRPIRELTEIYTGGAPVFPRTLRRLHRVAPQATLVAVYGSTEAEPIAHVAWSDISPDDHRAMENGAGLLAGHPVDAIDLRILPDRWGTPIDPFDCTAFEQQALCQGQIGEIVVAGEHVLGGYLGGVGDSETKFRVAGRVWHRTGDAGYLDAHGRLWLMGRCSAKLQDAHGVLYPFAAETAALTVDWLRRCAVVEHRGARVIVAELEGRPAEDAAAVLKDRLAWAHIEDVLVVDALPVDKRHNAKIDYPALKTLLDRRK